MKIENLETTFRLCLKNGSVREKAKDVELIRSLRGVSEKGLEFIKKKSGDIPKDSTDWTFVFRDYYESLRCLIEALILFDRVEADNHQCKNACACAKHPELDLDWEFLETIRLKRNLVNYRGQLLTYEEWNGFKPKFESHIEILGKAIDKRLALP